MQTQTSDKEHAIGRLDGFLAGTSSISGRIRNFSAFAYALKSKDFDQSPESLIQKHFESQTTIELSNSVRLNGGMREFESSIRPFLIRHPFGLEEQSVSSQIIEARQAFLSFRVLDMVSAIAADAYATNCVYCLESVSAPNQSKCTFFCVQIEDGYLVLQFNDDRPFNAATK